MLASHFQDKVQQVQQKGAYPVQCDLYGHYQANLCHVIHCMNTFPAKSQRLWYVIRKVQKLLGRTSVTAEARHIHWHSLCTVTSMEANNYHLYQIISDGKRGAYCSVWTCRCTRPVVVLPSLCYVAVVVPRAARLEVALLDLSNFSKFYCLVMPPPPHYCGH